MKPKDFIHITVKVDETFIEGIFTYLDKDKKEQVSDFVFESYEKILELIKIGNYVE